MPPPAGAPTPHDHKVWRERYNLPTSQPQEPAAGASTRTLPPGLVAPLQARLTLPPEVAMANCNRPWHL